MTGQAAHLARLLDESPSRLAVFPVDREWSVEEQDRRLRSLLDAVAALSEFRAVALSTFHGEHEDFPDADRIYVVHEKRQAR